MKKVCLYSLEQVGIVVLAPSEVTYWNKSGDVDPRFQAEGILIPVSNDPPEDQPELSLLHRLQALTGNMDLLNPLMVGELDALLYEVSSSDAIGVDPTKMGDSSAGWVHLTIRPQGEFSYFVGFGGSEKDETETLQGVLTWPCNVKVER